MTACSPASRLIPVASNIIMILKTNETAKIGEEIPSIIPMDVVRAETAAEWLLGILPVPNTRPGANSLAKIRCIGTLMICAKIIATSAAISGTFKKNEPMQSILSGNGHSISLYCLLEQYKFFLMIELLLKQVASYHERMFVVLQMMFLLL